MQKRSKNKAHYHQFGFDIHYHSHLQKGKLRARVNKARSQKIVFCLCVRTQRTIFPVPFLANGRQCTAWSTIRVRASSTPVSLKHQGMCMIHAILVGVQMMIKLHRMVSINFYVHLKISWWDSSCLCLMSFVFCWLFVLFFVCFWFTYIVQWAAWW